MVNHLVITTRFDCFDLAHTLNYYFLNSFSKFKSMLLVGSFLLQKKIVGFEFSLGQHNMENKLNKIFFPKHAKHEKLLNAIWCKTMQG